MIIKHVQTSKNNGIIWCYQRVATMNKEVKALNDNHMCEFVDLPHNAYTIGSKWVYK